MRLILNEQEIVDGVCVFVANEGDFLPEYVDVKELNYHRNGEFTSLAKVSGLKYHLDTDQIIQGIEQFLEEYHSFNPEIIRTVLNFTEGQGVWAEVFVNE